MPRSFFARYVLDERGVATETYAVSNDHIAEQRFAVAGDRAVRETERIVELGPNPTADLVLVRGCECTDEGRLWRVIERSDGRDDPGRLFFAQPSGSLGT
ncbi:MAG: hypothetical protein JW751_30725 [Polyangiaceae bacterium]|nr:hypothetical protein [Polyangiaceae bacterium]